MRFWLAGAVAAAMISAPCLAQDVVKIGHLNTIADIQVHIAEEKGYFKDEGLDVDIVAFNGTGTLLPQMTAKRVQVGYPNPDVLIVSRQPVWSLSAIVACAASVPRPHVAPAPDSFGPLCSSDL
mgnify:CR=1 FL=1